MQSIASETDRHRQTQTRLEMYSAIFVLENSGSVTVDRLVSDKETKGITTERFIVQYKFIIRRLSR